MPLQTGVWKLNNSGILGSLNIESVDTVGHVLGSASIGGSADLNIFGFWDEISGKLSFVADPKFSGGGATYIGFLFQDSFRMPGIVGGSVSTLTGYFHSWPSSMTAGSRDKQFFGWYAQIGA